ncbi:GDSL lipase family protein [Hydrogenimonas sp.]|nr:GDSL lipase family protein [Hydrogenimonas sp.]
MKISRLEFIVVAILLFTGLHFYNQYKMEKELPLESAEELQAIYHDGENPPVIVAFGDSLTYGTGARSAGVDNSYPAQLSKMLGLKVINEGVPGEMAETAHSRLTEVLKRYKPSIIILCEGGNDMLRARRPENIKRDLKNMVDAALNSGAEVILLGVPELTAFFHRDAGFYREIADETGVLYIPDTFSDLFSDDSLMSDQIHPNAKGYAIIARKIYEAIRGTL